MGLSILYFSRYTFKKKIFDFLKCTLNAKKTNDINRKFYFISRGLDDRGHF